MTHSDPRYSQDPSSILGGGMHLLQINPPMAVNMAKGDDFGWLFSKAEDGSWAKERKLSEREIDEAWDQVADMAVLDASAPLPAPAKPSLLSKLFGGRAAPAADPAAAPNGPARS